MSGQSVKSFLEGFWGRAILILLGGATTVSVSVGAWYARQVGDKQDTVLHEVQDLKVAMERKVSRDEYEHRLERMERDVKDAYAKLDSKLDSFSALLMSKFSYLPNRTN